MTCVLITGISGFVGSHLTEYLLLHDQHVSGFDLRPGKLPVAYHQGEITDRAAVASVLRKTRPDIIFHLAGMIKSPDADALYKANLLGSVSLFDSIMETDMRPVVVVASSSAVYGHKSGEKPISEKADIHPVTHYAVSKIAQELAALRYFNSYGLPVMVLRMFNLLGPGQPVNLACSSFAHQIAMAELHGGAELLTGNLDAQRDFVDVRDVVRAFKLTAEKGVPGQVYNVCSGRAVKIQTCLNKMISMSSQPIKVKVDAGRIQNHDVPIQIGNAEKINLATGWHPQISLKQSLSDLLNDWRQRIKTEVE
jgi:GDP-4-dehydro-6-deoxy-D-mannose reductase